MNTDITKQMEMVLYRTDDDNITVSALIKDETIWLTQKAMAELFGIDKSGISRHLTKIFETGELDEEVVVAKIATTTQHGAMQDKTQTTSTNYYNLDAIISVGYRVNSIQATQFRIWATNILKEYMIKGFAMDDERLKQGKTAFGKDYFRELLERVRSIRASERRIWQQITDIFAECSIDYDKNSDIAENPLDIEEVLEALDIKKYRTRFPKELSGGQQQRVAIARAMIKNPKLLLCDELTGALDTKSSRSVLKFVEKMNKQFGTTIIIITHNEAISQMADRIIWIKDGKTAKSKNNENKISAENLEL